MLQVSPLVNNELFQGPGRAFVGMHNFTVCQGCDSDLSPYEIVIDVNVADKQASLHTFVS